MNIWSNLCCKSGNCGSNPFISLLAISLKNTPVLQAGSKNVVSGFLKSSCGKRSSIWFTISGGVKTSSLERFARQLKTSGL
ncbi:MAG: hypothetical protein VZQ61_03595 [Christensenellaceae bacterium]